MTYTNKTIRFTLIAVLAFISNNLFSQATTTVASTNGYFVNVSLTPKDIIAPNSCQYGYNYNTKIDYNITFTGSNIPNKLYTLQTNMYCSSQANFSSLPLGGGSGQVVTHSNPYRNASDCGNATVSSLACNTFTLIIQGPGIAYQTITLVYNAPLPVKYASMSADIIGNNAKIQWITSSEVNNKNFTVERSINGTEWKEVASVDAAQTGTVNSYEIIDNNPLTGHSFYRIRQNDFSGEFSYSETMSVYNNKVDYKLFPNPAISTFNIQSENIADLEITVFNTQGQTVNVQSEINGNTITFDIQSLPVGIYTVTINDGSTNSTERLNVVK